MNQSDIHLLDLPNEILLIILKKLDNIDVLYSLFGINNQRLDSLVQDDIFTSTLDLATTSSITDFKLNRFCASILPRCHHSVKKVIVDTTSMECILRAGDYPNLTSLEVFNFEQKNVFRHFTDNSVLHHIFQDQITDIILHNNDKYIKEMWLDVYTKHVYAQILALFKNLEHLTIVSSSLTEYPPLSVCNLLPTAYFSSTLTVLCIEALELDDCFDLLDGQLKQLSTFIVRVHYIYSMKLVRLNKGELHNLKYFSLTSYEVTSKYDELVVPLLRRMTHLEKLTLYLRIYSRSAFVDGTHLHNEILVHMPQLHTFIFYISTEKLNSISVACKSNDDIQQTFTNRRYGQTACIVDCFNGDLKAICHVYSLPFTFTRLEKITTHFAPIVFDTVTHLSAYDMISMKHEFFMRISRAFPVLKYFSMENERGQTWYGEEWKSDENSSSSVIEFPHLISLDIMYAHIDYIGQFLLETKTHLPRLTELKVMYDQLKTVTMNFTRDKTRRNCSQVKQLIVRAPRVISKDVYEYFPSL